MQQWLKPGLVASVLFAAAPVFAAEAPPIESFSMDNGMEVVIIPNHRVPAVSHMLWFRVGAADDPPGKSGLAHYHEHMMYEGSPHYTSGQYASIISSQGGQENAFTGYDATSYYVNISKEKLPMVMTLEADRMRGLRPLDDDALKEKEVIIEERRQRIENNPDALLSEQMNAALFRHHPYQIPVIGWMHEMKNLTKDDVLKFHRTWYHPNNSILIISGDITAAEVKPLVAKYYGGLPKVALPPRRWNEDPPQNVARRLVMHHHTVQQPSWSRGYVASSLGYGKKDEALALFALSQILGGGKTSRLYQSLVVDQKLASSIDTSYDGFNIGPAQFEIALIPEPNVDLKVMEEAVDKAIEKIIAEGFTEEELKRAKTLLKADSTYARDGLASMGRIMGWLRIVGMDKDYFNRWPQLIDDITLEQVNTAARNTLQINQSVTGWLLPEAKTEENKKEEEKKEQEKKP